MYSKYITIYICIYSYFNFDGNGFMQDSYIFNEKLVNMRNTNHTLVYLPGSYKEINGDLGAEECILSSLGIDIKEFESLENKFSNVKIHSNYFRDSGAALDIQDSGGDFILIINPDISNDVYIENNRFEN